MMLRVLADGFRCGSSKFAECKGASVGFRCDFQQVNRPWMLGTGFWLQIRERTGGWFFRRPIRKRTGFSAIWNLGVMMALPEARRSSIAWTFRVDFCPCTSPHKMADRGDAELVGFPIQYHWMIAASGLRKRCPNDDVGVIVALRSRNFRNYSGKQKKARCGPAQRN